MHVRPFVADDLQGVLDVLRLSLGEPPGLERTAALFTWKHFENPFGPSLLFVAEEGDRMAGFRAFMRWDLIDPQGDRLRCVRAVDTATHPEFQRRGVFRQLTLAGIEAAESAGCDLIFNTPNEKSGAGYLTMGWHRVGDVGVMVRPGLGLLRRSRSVGWEPGIPAPAPGELAEAAPLLARAPHGWRTPRSPAYLQWRFGAHPTARYLLARVGAGVAIGRAHIRRGRRELVLSEAGGHHRAIRGLRSVSRPDYTVAWFSPQAPERQAAQRSGMVPIPGRRALTLMARPLRGLDVDLSWPNWDFSLGDLELL